MLLYLELGLGLGPLVYLPSPLTYWHPCRGRVSVLGDSKKNELGKGPYRPKIPWLVRDELVQNPSEPGLGPGTHHAG